MSERKDPMRSPKNRDKCLSVALLRLVGASQVEAANAAGVDPRTVGRWERCSWWSGVQAEASSRWLAGLTAKARAGLEKAVADDGRLALSVLERLVPDLAPPSARLTVGTLDYSEMTNDELSQIAQGMDPALVLAGRRGRA